MVATAIAASPASAGSNDLELSSFGACEFDGSECASVVTDDRGFYSLARDVGLIFSPALGTTAETLGQAGFAVQVDQTFSVIDANEDYWEKAVASGNPSGTLALTQVHVRKGLPMSLEIGGWFSVLWDSQLMAIGSEIRWALHEDYLWPVPDLAVRGYVSTIVGHPQLQVTTTGAEFVTGVPIGVGNVMNITPYAGYNLGVVVMASRLIDATPLDPRPPVRGSAAAGSQPEFVFDVQSEVVHQGLVGARFQVGVQNLGFQALFSSYVQNYTATYALEF